MYIEKNLNEFTKAIASKTSTPGGGGASSLVSSIAISLGDMVGEFTVGKEKYKDVEDEMYILMERAEKLRIKFLDLIEEDAEAFEPLSKAYAIPKDNPKRDSAMETCLKMAMEVPLKIFNYSLEAIDILKEFGEKGSKIIISDAATGAALLYGALKGAAVNVKVNTKSMKDRAYAEQVNKYIDTKLEEAKVITDKIYNDIYLNY